MKRILFLLALTYGVSAQALECTSQETKDLKLQLVKEINSPLLTGKTEKENVENVFAGKISSSNFFQVTYELFNQEGEKFTFTLEKDLGISHCRARVCPNPFPQLQYGKLSSEGDVDEYFTCL